MQYLLFVAPIQLNADTNKNFRYEYPFIFGQIIKDSGTAQVFTSGNSLETSVLFQSQNFSTHPPSESEALYCEASIDIDDIKFRGGSTSSLLNIIEPDLRDSLEETLNEIACEEAAVLNDAIIDIVNIIGDFLGAYTGEIPDERNDVLLPEKNLEVPANSSIFKFSEEELLFLAVESINSMFGSMTDDISSPLGSGQDLGINKFLRSTILSDGYISLPATALFDNGIILEENGIIYAKVELHNIRIIGLDTLSEFQPLDIVGNYTLSNHFTWSNLEVEIDTTIIVSPPDKFDPVMIESATIRTKLDDIKLHLSFLMALDLGELDLGMILNIGSPEDLMSCAAGALYSLEVSGLSASITNISSPTVSGFNSGGIDHITSNLLNGIFEIYDEIFANLLPTISEIKVRDLINSNINEILEGGSSCQVFDSAAPNKYVNFFDLFLSETDALLEGGKGNSPYGELETMLISSLYIWYNTKLM
jgi:hypothetical protein